MNEHVAKLFMNLYNCNILPQEHSWIRNYIFSLNLNLLKDEIVPPKDQEVFRKVRGLNQELYKKYEIIKNDFIKLEAGYNGNTKNIFVLITTKNIKVNDDFIQKLLKSLSQIYFNKIIISLPNDIQNITNHNHYRNIKFIYNNYINNSDIENILMNVKYIINSSLLFYYLILINNDLQFEKYKR